MAGSNYNKIKFLLLQRVLSHQRNRTWHCMCKYMSGPKTMKKIKGHVMGRMLESGDVRPGRERICY